MAPPIDQSTLNGFSTGSRTLVRFPHHPKLIAEARRRHPSKSRNGDLCPPRIHRVTTMFVTNNGSDALRKRPLLQRITLNKGISKSSPLGGVQRYTLGKSGLAQAHINYGIHTPSLDLPSGYIDERYGGPSKFAGFMCTLGDGTRHRELLRRESRRLASWYNA